MNLLEVRVLLIFIFLDYFTGVLVAISEKKLNSTIGRRGIFNKVGVMICVVICKLIDTLQIVGFAPMLPIVALFFILNEVFGVFAIPIFTSAIYSILLSNFCIIFAHR